MRSTAILKLAKMFAYSSGEKIIWESLDKSQKDFWINRAELFLMNNKDFAIVDRSLKMPNPFPNVKSLGFAGGGMDFSYEERQSNLESIIRYNAVEHTLYFMNHEWLYEIKE